MLEVYVCFIVRYDIRTVLIIVYCSSNKRVTYNVPFLKDPLIICMFIKIRLITL